MAIHEWLVIQIIICLHNYFQPSETIITFYVHLRAAGEGNLKANPPGVWCLFKTPKGMGAFFKHSGKIYEYTYNSRYKFRTWRFLFSTCFSLTALRSLSYIFIIYVFSNENINFTMQISTGKPSTSFLFFEITPNNSTDDIDNYNNPNYNNFLVIFQF